VIKSIFLILIAAVIPLAAQTCNLPGPPTITNSVDGAAFRDFGFSAGSFLTIFGLNFQVPGELTPVGGADIINSRFPTVFKCLAVEVNNVRAPILYTEPRQVNVQIPTTAALGNVPVVVILNPGTANERRSNPWTIKLDQAWPSVFRFGLTECIAARFQDGTPAADPRFVPGIGARIPRIGEIVTLYVNGLGATEPVWQAGEIPTAAARVITANNVQVSLNGVTMSAADVLYAGLSPFSISGLYQINIRVPDNARIGDNPIVIRSAGFSSQSGIILPVQ
jgi:uncharacterized protein (TIGR03437 family)